MFIAKINYPIVVFNGWNVFWY